MTVVLKDEAIGITDKLAWFLYEWGYKEVDRGPDYVKLKKPWFKDNPLTGYRYEFDYWQLCKEELVIDIWSKADHKKIPRRFIQWWLENPYFGIRLKEKYPEIVCAQLFNKLTSKVLVEDKELQNLMRTPDVVK